MSDPEDSPFRPIDSGADPYGPRGGSAESPFPGPYDAPAPAYGQAPPTYGQQPPPGYGGPPQYGDGYSYGAGYGGYGSGYGVPPGYAYPGYAQPRNDTMAILSLVFGIVAWPLCFGYGIGVFLSIAGLVLGIISKRRIKSSEGMLTGDGMAIAGIVISALNIVVFVLGIVFLIWAIAASPNHY